MLANTVNKNKVFILNRAELEGKFEVSYYSPEIKNLEDLIRKKTSKKLSDFIVKLSSGATPSVTEIEKFYSDKQNGVPFLRVQNLQPNGILNIDDVKYINKETHENYLKRSQVNEGDLLIKITGVGRMAVASVAPEGFIGNTNQHMVVIKTESKSISEYLANYLNLDLVEKLATRRATGGTRPALDYSALKSIPIIEDIDFSMIKKAEILKQQKEIQANELLKSIDNYLLKELGLVLPEKNISLQSRIFTTKLSEISGIRFDPDYISKYKFLIDQKAKYKFLPLSDLITQSPQYGANEEALERSSENDIRYIRITDIDEIGNLKEKNWKTALNTSDKYYLNYNDLLFARSGSVGKCYIHKEIDKDAIFAGYLIRFVLDPKKANADYIFYFCNSSIYKFWVSAIERPAVQSNINSEEFKSMPIPLPPLEKQIEIAENILSIRTKAKQLQEEGRAILEKAKQNIEKKILE
nr:restriction endonuclease subunit S [Flavobacterium sp. ASV13]